MSKNILSPKIHSKWKPFTLTYIKAHETDNIGIYEVSDKNQKTLDIGRGKVKSRLILQNPNNKNTSKSTIWRGKYYRSQYTKNVLRSKQRERGLQTRHIKEHNGKLPPKNKRLGKL